METNVGTRKHRRKPRPWTTLDADEQSELVLKLRYGIGLDLLCGPQVAESLRPGLPARRVIESPPPEPPRPQRPDHEIRARAAALGITSGRRGQWICR